MNPPPYRWTAALVVLIACAGTPRTRTSGELTVDVEATGSIGTIDFQTEDGSDVAQLTAIEAGATHHSLRVRPGNWCLQQIGIGAGAVGITLVPATRQCVAVTAGGTTHWGTLVVDGQDIQITNERPEPLSY